MIEHVTSDIRYLLHLGLTPAEIGNRMSLPEDAVLGLLGPQEQD